MRIPAPSEALRAARALLKLSQRAAAERANVLQKSLSTVENTEHLLVNTNLVLLDFYVAQGIEFLGEASIGSEIVRSGARWTAPKNPEASQAVKASFHAEDVSVSFRAARALLNRDQAEVASSAGISRAAVKGLENGASWTDSHQKLVEFYENEGVEFTGWGDPTTGKFYGIGVRWKQDRPAPRKP